MSRDNTCIFCNESIPEGRMVCPVCEEALRNVPAEIYKEIFYCNIKERSKEVVSDCMIYCPVEITYHGCE